MTLPLWAVLLVILFVIIALIVALMARRLDRLNRTVVKSRRTLEHALTARAQYSHDFADAGILDLAGGILLVDAADRCLRHGMEPIVDDGLDAIGPWTPSSSRIDRRDLESNLSRTLRLTVDELRADEIPDEASGAYEQLQRARLDVQMTRSFHNSHVAQVHQIRRAPLAVFLRIAGKASMPATVDMDDE